MALTSALPDLAPISYKVGAENFTGYFADGSPGVSAPGVLVGHEGPGITQHIKERTQRIAALGYVAFALDLYGVASPSIDEAKGLVRRLRDDIVKFRRRVTAALEILKQTEHVDTDRIAAVGFCFGGTAALELARSGANIAGVVGFHAGLSTSRPDDAAAIRCPVIILTGADDPIITSAERKAFTEEMTRGGVDWRMHIYGGAGHSFTNRDIDAYGFPGFAYCEKTDKRSWEDMRAFLDEIFHQ